MTEEDKIKVQKIKDILEDKTVPEVNTEVVVPKAEFKPFAAGVSTKDRIKHSLKKKS